MDNEKDKIIAATKEGRDANSLVLRLFEKDNFIVFVYKKSEKIVSALYLVSNLLPNEEPIKWQFRAAGVAIISRLLSLTSDPLLKTEILAAVSVHFVNIRSLLDVLFAAGSISEMNYFILRKELENLLETLSHRGSGEVGEESKKSVITEKFFAVAPESFLSPSAPARKNLGVEEGKEMSLTNPAVYSWNDVSRLDAAQRLLLKGQKFIKDKTSDSSLGAEAEKRSESGKGLPPKNVGKSNDREAAILKHLEGKNSLTIKDFSLIIKDRSEKTIQRELLRLVAMGVLKKTGERRWSRYSLI